jgi:hypothetical protein
MLAHVSSHSCARAVAVMATADRHPHARLLNALQRLHKTSNGTWQGGEALRRHQLLLTVALQVGSGTQARQAGGRAMHV